jgi:hypothetical protein
VGVEVAVSQISPFDGSQVGVAVTVGVSQGPVAGLQGVAEGARHITPGWQVGVGLLFPPSGITTPLAGTAATWLAGPVTPATAAAVPSIAPSITRASTTAWKNRLAFLWMASLLFISRPSFVLPAGEDEPRHYGPTTNLARMSGAEKMEER